MERLKAEVENWAVKDGQEHVAIEITKQFFLLGGNDSIRLRRIESNGVADCKAIYNNRQQIFRWLRSSSRASQAKSEALRPAIIADSPSRASSSGMRFSHISRISFDFLTWCNASSTWQQIS
ncbi:toxin YdaT family protein [Pectobacterium carotovorum]|uniref:toxin YdaT family protein n=1 Tax=Pectobacterium carotovorum TaxID=554 RepID=UPI00193CEB41|nr:toxin YdaT family protein [Pectobacterium carotovorum]QRN39589.1 hypothetical protein IHJ55_06870 [Pectobacterium carotovorum]